MTTINSQYYVKTCPRCGQTKSMDDFSYREQAYDKCSIYCKACQKLWVKKYPKRIQNTYYKYQYGISLEQKEELARQQKGCCYLCDNVLPSNTKHQHIEHDKETGQIYGLACRYCNTGIAMFNHDPYLMVKVAKRMLRLRRKTTNE